MSKYIAKYISKCHKCQINKAKIKNMEPMTLTPTPQKAFDIVSIDTIGPFQKSNKGHIYAVTIQCELTKFVVIIPTRNKEAGTVAKAIFESFILVYGPMKEIRTDMGSEYRNQIFENLSKLIKIDHKISTAYHSQTIGTCERNHRVFNEYARMYINDTQSDWDTWARYYAFCYNTTPSSYHNYTPYELVFAKRAELDSFLSGTDIDPLYNIDAYDQEVRFRLQSAHKRVGEDLDKAKRERKLRYDNQASELDLQTGDYVTVTNEARTKLNPLYKGPFPVVSIDGPNCIIDDKGKQITVHKNRVQKYVNA